MAVGDRVAAILHVRPGDVVKVEMLGGTRRTMDLPVVQVIQSYIGLAVYMNIDELSRLAWGAPRITHVNLQLDGGRLDDFYRAVKDLPQVASAALLTVSRRHFQDTMQQNMNMQLIVYLVLSIIIAIGVVYNAARIQLSERAAELATLRVLGFSRAEVFNVLLVELGVIVALAQPLGWALGYLLGIVVTSGLASDLFRVPFVVEAGYFRCRKSRRRGLGDCVRFSSSVAGSTGSTSSGSSRAGSSRMLAKWGKRSRRDGHPRRHRRRGGLGDAAPAGAG